MRSCIGRRLAELELTTLASRACQVPRVTLAKTTAKLFHKNVSAFEFEYVKANRNGAVTRGFPALATDTRKAAPRLHHAHDRRSRHTGGDQAGTEVKTSHLEEFQKFFIPHVVLNK